MITDLNWSDKAEVLNNKINRFQLMYYSFRFGYVRRWEHYIHWSGFKIPAYLQKKDLKYNWWVLIVLWSNTAGHQTVATGRLATFSGHCYLTARGVLDPAPWQGSETQPIILGPWKAANRVPVPWHDNYHYHIGRVQHCVANARTTSYDSCVSHFRWNHVKLSSTRLCPADSTTVTVCSTVSTNFNSICCSLSFVPLLAWFSVSGNLIRSPWKFATSCIGSLWGRGSNSRFERRFTNVYTEELHLTSLRWRCQSPIHQPCDVCDLQQPIRGDLIIPSLKTVRFGREVSMFPGQPCGTLYRSTSDSANRLNHLRNN